MPDLGSPFNPLVVLQSATAGRFAIEREIGRGGMGIVYLARDLALDRPVAVKMLPPLAALATVSRERFIREAKITASLSHPNILPVYVFEEAANCSFFVTAYVDGETLAQRVDREGPLNAESGMRILREVAWALDHAHLRGVIHRDVKPGNIMLERETGRALVMDFGIAHGPYERLSLTGEAVGTFGFASPEQMEGAEADLKADIYGLGATAFFVFSGSPPESHESDQSLYSARIDIPRRVADVLSRCISVSPSERPESAGAIADSMSTGLSKAGHIPEPLKNWITVGQGLTELLLIYTSSWFFILGWEGLLIPFNLMYLLVNQGLPWLAFGTFRLSRLVLVVGQGYGIADIRNALHHWRRQRMFRLAIHNRRLPPTLARGGRWLTLGAIGFCVTISGLDWLHRWPEYRSQWQPVWNADLGVRAFNAALVGFLIGWVWPRWGGFERDYFADFRRSFWDSRCGPWMVAVARFMSRAWYGRKPMQPPMRHTEVSLREGVAELYAQLTPSLQSYLKTLPATATHLERRAVEFRQAIGRLRDLESSALPPSIALDSAEHGEVARELLAKRASLEARHLEITRSLEQLRLGLMRLVARAESASGSTGPLDEAEEMTQLLRHLDDAQRTVES